MLLLVNTMAEEVYCNNCGSVTKPKVAGSFLITFILIWFLFIPALMYQSWRMNNRKCRACGSATIMPLVSPAAQQAIQIQQAYLQSQLAPEPKPDLPPTVGP